MADSQVKTHVPSAAIFQSDPLEQIYAKGVMGPDSGLAYMFLNAAQQNRGADQAEYMKGVQEANRINTALHSQDVMSKQAIEVLKQAVTMAHTAGSDTSRFPIWRMLNPTGANDVGAQAVLAKLQSEAAANNAKAMEAGGDKSEVTVIADPQGPAISQYKFKGRDPNSLAQKRDAAIKGDKESRLPGGPMSVKGTGPNTYGMTPMQIEQYKQRMITGQ